MTGRRLWAVRATWIALVAPMLLLFLAAIPLGIEQVTASADADALAVLGITPRAFAVYLTILHLLLVAVFGAVAVLLILRRSDDWLVLASALCLIAFSVQQTDTYESVLLAWPGAELPLSFLRAVYGIALTLVLVAFPSGRVVPSRAWILVPISVPIAVVGVLLRHDGAVLVSVALGGAWYAFSMIVQAWRYRSCADDIERQQSKWVLFGLVTASTGYYLFQLLVAAPLAAEATPERYVALIVGLPLAYLVYLAVPIGVAFSILHHRLYDIDMVIQRALVYVPLTAILAGILSLVVTVAQAVVVAVTGERSDLVTALATLVVVASFEPLRAGMQALVDRAFKNVRDPAAEVRALEAEVRRVLDVLDADRLARRTLDVITRAYEPTGAAILLVKDGVLERIASTPGWAGTGALVIPIESGGRRVGTIAVGARRSGAPWTARDRAALSDIAATFFAAAVEGDDVIDPRRSTPAASPA